MLVVCVCKCGSTVLDNGKMIESKKPCTDHNFLPISHVQCVPFTSSKHKSTVSGCDSGAKRNAETTEESKLEAVLEDYSKKRKKNSFITTSLKVNDLTVDSFEEFKVQMQRPSNIDFIKENLGLASFSLNDRDMEEYGLKELNETELYTIGEEEFQQKFNVANSSNQRIALTVDSNKNTATFTSQGFYYSGTAKCDVTSTVRPMCAEVKAKSFQTSYKRMEEPEEIHFATVKQAVQRVECKASLHHQYQSFCSFAIAHNFAWFVYLTHNWIKTDTEGWMVEDTLQIFPLEEGVAVLLWALLTKVAETNPQSLYTPIAPYVSHYLRQFKDVPPGFVRVVPIGVSASIVVGITFPQMNKSPYKGEKLVLSMLCKHVAIKIVLGDTAFGREKAALRRMWEHLDSHVHPANISAQDHFYAIGYHDVTDDETSYGLIKWSAYFEGIKTYLKTLKHKTESLVGANPWWYCHCEAPPSTGGIIVMRCANYKLSSAVMSANASHVLQSVLSWLPVISGAKMVHCDIRRTNIMHFEEPVWSFGHFQEAKEKLLFEKRKEDETADLNLSAGWQLVDYGMARPLNSDLSDSLGSLAIDDEDTSDFTKLPESATVSINKGYGQYKGAGFTVKRLGRQTEEVSFTYQWQLHDDYEMAFNAYLELQQFNQVNEN